MPRIRNTNDGSHAPPYLRVEINAGNVYDLPPYSRGPHGTSQELHAAAKAAGFQGIQGGDPALCAALGLDATGMGRVDAPGDADQLAADLKAQGYTCATVHAGAGMESEQEMIALAREVVAASERHDFPLYIETHRATITQDQWRTVHLVDAVPEVRFNGDFSHWYTGQEMVYGDIEARWRFLAPVFERVRFLHGRIGNPGSIQVGIAATPDALYVQHFREMWIRSMLGFLRSAQPGDYLVFAPELLGPSNYYARLLTHGQGEQTEESDRWQEALLYADLARECFAEAERRLAPA